MGVLLIMCLALSTHGDAAVDPSGDGIRVGVVAHRGAGAGASRSDRPPENTLEACRWGWTCGSPWVECDVVLAGDGVPVVTHDFSTDRFTEQPLQVDESSVEELKTLDMGAWKDPRWKGLRMPSLADVLASIPGDRGLVIEIKSGEESAEPVVDAIKSGQIDLDQVMIISFNVDTLRAVKRLCPAVTTFWLMSFKVAEGKPDDAGEAGWTVSWRAGSGRGRSVQQPADLEAILAAAKRDGFDGLSTSVKQPPELAGLLEAAGLHQGTWTVNDPQQAVQLVRAGVDEITTDDPPAVLEALRAAGFRVGLWPRIITRADEPGD